MRYYYYSPKRNAERRLRTNIYYKQMKNDYNNARYNEVKYYNDIYEEYKEKEKYYIPTFIDLDDFDLKNEMDYDYYWKVSRPTATFNLNYEKKQLTEKIKRLEDKIKEYEKELQDVIDVLGVENVRLYRNCGKNEYQLYVEQSKKEFKEKERKIKIQIGEMYEEIYAIEYEINEMKKYKEKYERNESEIWRMKKEIMQDNKYLQDLYININLGFFANLFKEVSDLDYFMSEYERICDKWELNKMITKECIKEMNKNYKYCHELMEKAKALRNNSKGKIL